MGYLALYRKYRPSNLDEMVGQEEIKIILTSSVVNGTISHAYLFSGPRGTGKTSTAKIFAKMVNCEAPVNGNACGKCNSCLSVLDSSDIVEIDAASNNGVDEIRELREKANLVPSICKYKVYIIDEVHMLTTQAFNALLKTLEEPPKHVIFILATTEYHKVPLTITSRCQKFQFNKLSNDLNTRKLREIADNEKIEITDDALYEIANISDGGMRDSINFLDQLRSYKSGNITVDDVYYVCGNVSFSEISNLLINVINGEALLISNYLEDIGNKGKSYSNFLVDILSFLRDVILFKNDVSHDNIKSNIECITEVASLYGVSQLYMIVDMINGLLEKLKYCSRQSIVVVTNFLLVMDKIGNNKSELTFKKVNVTKSDESSKTDDDSKLSNISLQAVNDEKDKITNKYMENREIIVNNAMATADKNSKKSLQEKFLKVNDYLLDKKYALMASKMKDASIEVVGSEYVIFSTEYESIIDFVYDNYKLCSEFINDIFGSNFYFAFIDNNMWNEYKEKYINDYKNGKKYKLKELIIIQDDFKNEKKSKTAIDKLIDIVGDDIIEYK